MRIKRKKFYSLTKKQIGKTTIIKINHLKLIKNSRKNKQLKVMCITMLTERDKAIIRDLKRFRVMDRDSISEIHFFNVKNPKDSTNHVLLRLLRDGHIQRSKSFVPYVYFSSETNIKKDSAKIGHFLAILK